LLVAAILFAGYLGTKKTVNDTVAGKGTGTPAPPPSETGLAPAPKPSEELVVPKPNQVAGVRVPSVTSVTSPISNNKPRIKPRQVASADFSSQVAPTVSADSSFETEQVFPIDASQQSLRVSLFDKKGNPKTISLPTVSFGSQRVVPTAASYAPKGVW
jgi:hypothetical protein